MKKVFFILIAFLFLQTAYAQDAKFKFGTVSIDDLKMTQYSADTTAPAVVLYESMEYYYTTDVGSFILISEYVVRIKILTTEGVDYANATIPFLKGINRTPDEKINGLTAYTYNLENGKIVKEQLDKKYIFTEDVVGRYKQLKFAMPAAKPGSIIEYKYSKISPNFAAFIEYYFQRDIPVVYSSFEIQIPSLYTMSREVKGFEPLIPTIKKNNHKSFALGGTRRLDCSAEEIRFEAKNLPALKDDDYVWNYKDFLSGVIFELQRIYISDINYSQNFSSTWNDIANRLKEDEDFGKAMNYTDLFGSSLTAAMADKTTDVEKLRAVLELVQASVKWNERKTLYVNNPKKALKEGLGTSGDVNALLLCALKEAGFKPYPVIMSTRSNGRLPRSYASDISLNYFVVGVPVGPLGDVTYYLDATRTYTDVNVLPTDCMVDRALAMLPTKNVFVNLSDIVKSRQTTSIGVTFNADGQMEGKCIRTYSGESTYAFQQKYNAAKDENEYLEKLAHNNELQISDYTQSVNKGVAYNATESYNFTKTDFSANNTQIISFNPLLFMAINENAFKAETRKLPIEFSFPYETRVNVEITPPEGYVLDEAPTSEKFVYESDQASFTYVVKPSGDKVLVTCQLVINTSIIPASNYQHFRDFWSKMVAKNNQIITFVKQ